MARLILMMGLPGSGKTTHAVSLKGIKLHIDEIRKVLTGSYLPGDQDELVYRTVHASVDYYLRQGKNVIVDGALLSKKARSYYITLAKKHFTFVELYWFDASKPLLEMRLYERNQKVEKERKIDLNYLSKISQHFEMPTRDEGIDLIHWLTDAELIALEK